MKYANESLIESFTSKDGCKKVEIWLIDSNHNALFNFPFIQLKFSLDGIIDEIFNLDDCDSKDLYAAEVIAKNWIESYVEDMSISMTMEDV